MERKKTIILDITKCKYLGEIHQRIKKAFGFPDFYGENWSAFEDLLWSECDADRVIVMGENFVAKNLQPSVEVMKKILYEWKAHRQKYGQKVEIEVED
ncbi:MAG: barstar family protein [Acutalibacter sp.]|nr:barstar family protein [Acutalibacter sp.]